MSFNREYTVGQRAVAVVPLFSSDNTSLANAENGNGGGRRLWRDAQAFKLVEFDINYVNVAPSLNGDSRHIRELGGAQIGPYNPYWSFNSDHLRVIIENVALNRYLTPAAKKFVMKYSIPAVVGTPAYMNLLRDITRAMGTPAGQVSLASVEDIRAEAQELGIAVAGEDEVPKAASAELNEGTADRLGETMERMLRQYEEAQTSTEAEQGSGPSEPEVDVIDFETSSPDPAYVNPYSQIRQSNYAINPFGGAQTARPSGDTESDANF